MENNYHFTHTHHFFCTLYTTAYMLVIILVSSNHSNPLVQSIWFFCQTYSTFQTLSAECVGLFVDSFVNCLAIRNPLLLLVHWHPTPDHLSGHSNNQLTNQPSSLSSIHPFQQPTSLPSDALASHSYLSANRVWIVSC